MTIDSPDDFKARSVSLNGVLIKAEWQYVVGGLTAARSAETVGLDDALSDGDEVEVEVEDIAGVTRRFKVVLRIKWRGEVTEIAAPAAAGRAS